MPNICKIYYLIILSSLLLTGCGAVEWQHKHPSLNEGEPFALLNEEELYADNITSTIKGFYDNRNQNPDEIKEPVMKDYSTGAAVMKGLYTVSPYGWMTLPFADFEGRTIAIPAREIGIVMHRRYYKELLKKEVVVLREGDLTSAKSSSVSDVLPMGKVGTVIYLVKFENLEWDDQLWFSAIAGEEYKLILSKGIIRNSENMVVAGKEVARLPMPTGMKPEAGKHIVTDGGVVLGKRYVVAVSGNIYIYNENEDITASVIKKPDFKPKDKSQLYISNPILTSLDGKDIILTGGDAPDGQKIKLIVPSGKGLDSATILSEDSNEQLDINVNKWINKLMETSNTKYVDPNLQVTPILSGIGNCSLAKQEVIMVNNQLKTNGFELSVFPSDQGLEVTRMVF